VDLQMHMDWHRGRSIISDGAGGTVEENGASGMLKSKVLVPVEWSVWIGRTWRGVFEVVKTWDNRILRKKHLCKYKIRSNQAISSGWNEKERYSSRKTT
jgi:hypothetical protein